MDNFYKSSGSSTGVVQKGEYRNFARNKKNKKLKKK
jgi:hypothetical protein